MTQNTYLVVGLGNPGPTYVFTRHNAGYWAVDDIADRYGATFRSAARLRAQVTQVMLPSSTDIDVVKLLLTKPTTYMNEAGAAVRAVSAFHKIPPERVIAIHDDLDLDPGRLRIKLGGGDGGHNGLKSVRAHLGTGEFLRVRIGIGRPPGRQPAADYVLSRLRPQDSDALRVDAAVAGDAVEYLARHGLVAAQNRYNG